MTSYIIKRLLLLPLTLFCILLVNFVIINMAPGDPVSVTEISPDGASRSESESIAFSGDDRYLQFREFYGLTLPVLVNPWPFTSLQSTLDTLFLLERYSHLDSENGQEFNDLRIHFSDKARFIMPHLLMVAEMPDVPLDIRKMALRFFVRGGTRQGYVGSHLTEEERTANRKIAQDNNFLMNLAMTPINDRYDMAAAALQMKQWYDMNESLYNFDPSTGDKVGMFFFETRFWRYMGRVLTLDFGTMRNDPNQTVIHEVTKRFKYSLTLSVIPMLITFVLSQLFGFLMAHYQNRAPDYTMNLSFLVLYAIPVFVVAPFLIEKVAMGGVFPFTGTPIPTSGFTSPEDQWVNMFSYQKVLDVMQHIALPVVAVMYGSLAATSRLSRTAVLEVMRLDYVKTAYAKGLSPSTVLFKHVGRNAAITIVTSLAGSLGILLSGSLIVETLFEINGYGRFFYEAVLNRDYNVIMFSAIAGSFLTLAGYLVADLTYTLLDPRVTLE